MQGIVNMRDGVLVQELAVNRPAKLEADTANLDENAATQEGAN